MMLIFQTCMLLLKIVLIFTSIIMIIIFSPQPVAENKMACKITITDIKNLGFEWPRYPLIERYCGMEDGKINLTQTLEKMQSSRTYYKKQLNDAFAFKRQTGADYSDFSDHFDDYARMERELSEAITYIEEIIGVKGE